MFLFNKLFFKKNNFNIIGRVISLEDYNSTYMSIRTLTSDYLNKLYKMKIT